MNLSGRVRAAKQDVSTWVEARSWLAMLRQPLVWALLMAFLWGGLRFNHIQVGTFFDDAHYIVLAESLSSGQGYRLINYPYAPVEPAFPPGWPLLLAPLVWLFPDNFTVLKLLTFTLWLASLFLIYRLWLQHPTKGGVALLLVAANPHLAGMAGTVMSEAAYLFFSLLSFHLLQVWEERRNPWLLVAMMVTAVYALMIRTVGITLVAGLVTYLLFRYQRRYLRWLIGLLVFGLGPLAWFYSRYQGQFIFSELYSQHVVYVLGEIGRFLRFWQHLPALDYPTMAHALIPVFNLEQAEVLLTANGIHFFSLLLFLMVVAGFFLRWPHYQATEFYIFFYVGLLYVWFTYINHVQLRQLLPILPFLYYYLVQSIVWLGEKLTRSQYATLFTRVAAVGLLMICFLFNLYAWQRPERERITNLELGTTWIRQNSAPDVVVMTEDAVPEYLYMRRQTLNYPRYGEMAATINEYGVDYVMLRPSLAWWDKPFNFLNRFTVRHVRSFIIDHPRRFTLVYQDRVNNVHIYQINPSIRDSS